ncbi:hypothetical protein LTR95_002478, partial [Oleoguttula sp. CCFEE 5521]
NDASSGTTAAEPAVAEPPPFLDFLYPPPALTMLQLMSDGSRTRQRRETRRVPIAGSRGFASGGSRNASDAGSASTSTYTPTLRDRSEPVTRDIASLLGDQSPRNIGRNNVPQSDLPPDRNALTKHVETDDNASFLDSPGDIAESDGKSLPALRQLKRLITKARRDSMDGTFPDDTETTTQAWALYCQLDESDRNELFTKEMLLTWLSTQSNEAAEAHCLEVYNSIPHHHRSIAVYKAASSMFVRCHLLGLAEQAHEEALARLHNGFVVSGHLCKIALGQNRWDLAFKIKQQLDHRFQDSAVTEAMMSSTFWRDLATFPSLFDKAMELAKHMMLRYRSDVPSSEFNQFCQSLFKTALREELVIKNVDNAKPSAALLSAMDGRTIRYMLGYFKQDVQETVAFFKELILAILQPASGIPYANAHKIISFMYSRYRKRDGVAPSRGMLGLLQRGLIDATDELDGFTMRNDGRGIHLHNIETDWVKFHGKIGRTALVQFMKAWAGRGRPDRVEHYWQLLRTEYPDIKQQADALWALVYVHARRADVDQARKAFDSIVQLTGLHTDLVSAAERRKIWAVLLHAHSRADDLDGAIDALQQFMQLGDDKPNQYIFHPVLELYASRGDVESVHGLLLQFDALSSEKRSTALYGSLMTAHVNDNDINSAVTVLEEAVTKQRNGDIEGQLTGCFNILLTAFAIRREIDSTMRVYRRMRAESVALDADSYGALMLALTLYHQTASAHQILSNVMPKNDMRPTAFHYAIVMTGYINQKKPKEALELHRQMKRLSVRPSTSSNAAYLKARAMSEGAEIAVATPDGVAGAESLSQTIRALKSMSDADLSAPHAARQPQNVSLRDFGSVEAMYYGQLIAAHGTRQCFVAAKELVRQFKQAVAVKDSKDSVKPQLPIVILNALMITHQGTQAWDEVDARWKLAKEQADIVTAFRAPPTLIPLSNEPGSLNDLSLPALEDATPTTSVVRRVEHFEPALMKAKHAPALRHILSTSVRRYISALHLQGRYNDMVSTVAGLLREGYMLDNRTWNTFISNLVRRERPLALLAFRLTERYLIPSFPGWAKRTSHKPTQATQTQGLSYINARYLPPQQLMPQYQTLVMLASAFLKLRRLEAVGVTPIAVTEEDKAVEKYVGTAKLIRKYAPRTLFAVQNMPSVDDNVQRKSLKGEQRS